MFEFAVDCFLNGHVIFDNLFDKGSLGNKNVYNNFKCIFVIITIVQHCNYCTDPAVYNCNSKYCTISFLQIEL